MNERETTFESLSKSLDCSQQQFIIIQCCWWQKLDCEIIVAHLILNCVCGSSRQQLTQSAQHHSVALHYSILQTDFKPKQVNKKQTALESANVRNDRPYARVCAAAVVLLLLLLYSVSIQTDSYPSLPLHGTRHARDPSFNSDKMTTVIVCCLLLDYATKWTACVYDVRFYSRSYSLQVYFLELNWIELIVIDDEWHLSAWRITHLWCPSSRDWLKPMAAAAAAAERRIKPK